MKFFIFLALFSLLSIAYSEEVWVDLSASDLDHFEVNHALNFGAENLTQDAIARGHLPEGTYHISSIQSAQKLIHINATNVTNSTNVTTTNTTTVTNSTNTTTVTNTTNVTTITNVTNATNNNQNHHNSGQEKRNGQGNGQNNFNGFGNGNGIGFGNGFGFGNGNNFGNQNGNRNGRGNHNNNNQNNHNHDSHNSNFNHWNHPPHDHHHGHRPFNHTDEYRFVLEITNGEGSTLSANFTVHVSVDNVNHTVVLSFYVVRYVYNWATTQDVGEFSQEEFEWIYEDDWYEFSGDDEEVVINVEETAIGSESEVFVSEEIDSQVLVVSKNGELEWVDINNLEVSLE